METNKSLTRREIREKALCALFQIFLGKNDIELAIQYVEETDNEFLVTLVKGVTDNLEQIDQTIKNNTEKWSIDRFGNVELNALRIATYEFLYQVETPQKVVMNEAIEIIKKFSDEKSVKFANSVLQKIMTSLAK